MHDPRSADPRDPVETLRSLAHVWSASAERAFATGLSDPAAYARTVRLVSATVAALRTLGESADELLTAWSSRRDVITAVAQADDLLTLDGLDLDAVAGAAFAMRYREVADATARARRLTALAAAGAAGRWVVAEESGPFQGDPYIPYRRLEVDRVSGRAILVSTHPDESFSAAVHAVHLLHFDSSTGRLDSPAPGSEPREPREFSNAEEREEYVAALHEHPGSTTPA